MLRKTIYLLMVLAVLCTACSRSQGAPLPTTSQIATQTDVVETLASAVVTSTPVSSLPIESSQTASKPADASSASSKPASSKTTSKAASKNKSNSSASSPSSSATKKPSVSVTPDKNETKIVTYTKRPTYQSVQKEIHALAEAYPQLIQVDSIGTSVQGRDLTLMKVGNGASKACIIAGIHAREGITVSYTMRCIEEFCMSYESDSGIYAEKYDMKNLLDVYTLYIVPLSNPDGLEIIGGRDTPEVEITYRPKKYTLEIATMEDYKGNANGVNLNKNFPFLWDVIQTGADTPDAENYKGTSAASEPETAALMALCEANDFLWMTSIHVRGDCIYWSDTENPSVGLSETVADQLKDRFGFYKCKTSDDVNGFGGGFENWFRATYQKPGFCLELMPLDIEVTPTSNQNHNYFSQTLRWSQTRGVLPIIMIYGFPR